MKKRTSEDNCLLCLEKKAAQRNSHIISAALLKKTIGKRDHELSYKISTAELLIDEFYGKSRLDNPSTTIKQNPHSRDYYFCPECEKRMGYLESEVTKHLANLTDPKFKQNYTDHISPGGLNYKILERLDSDKFNMFFLLTVWRMALLYSLERNIHTFKGYRGHELQLIGDILYWYLYGDVQKYELFRDQFGMMVFRAQSNSDPTRNFSLVIDFADRPNIFWAFEYMVLVYSAKDLEEAPKNNGSYFLLEPDFLLVNTPPIEPRIIMLDERTWDNLTTHVLHDTSQAFFHKMVSTLSEKTGLPGNFCHIMIYIRAKEMEAENGSLFSDCCIKAFEEILGKVKGK
jgi:hypothetical protein